MYKSVSYFLTSNCPLYSDVKQSWDYEYNDSGNEVIETEYKYNPYDQKKSFKIKIIRIYDEFSNLIEEKYYNSERMFKKNKYLYSGNGEIIELIQFGPDNKLNFKTIYKYDDYNNLILESTEGPLYDIFVERRISYTYDERRNIVEKTDNKDTGDLKYWKKFDYYDNRKLKSTEDGDKNYIDKKVKYTYLNEGKLIEKRIYNSYDELEHFMSTTYNDINLISEAIIYEGERKYAGLTYIYNEKGDIINEIYHDYSDNKITDMTFKYIYDSNNNWIEKEFYDSNRNLYRVNKRKIIYY